jgi:hypothetical protein
LTGILLALILPLKFYPVLIPFWGMTEINMKNHKGNKAFFSLVVGIIALSSSTVYGQNQKQRGSINHEVGATLPVMSLRAQNTDATSNHITKMKGDALNLIEEAIAYMKANGKDAALKAFNKQDGAFVKGELYVFALDY